MQFESFIDAWDSLGDETRSARDMELRSRLLMNLQQGVRDKGWDKHTAAQVLGISPAEVEALLSGKIGDFHIKDLVRLMETGNIPYRVTPADRALLSTLMKDEDEGKEWSQLGYSDDDKPSLL